MNFFNALKSISLSSGKRETGSVEALPVLQSLFRLPDKMVSIDVPNLVSLLLFYSLLTVVGIWAGRKYRHRSNDSESLMLAGREIGVVLGIFTLTASWVGGGFTLGIVETVVTKGLLWAQPPIGNCVSLVVGGLFFADRMRGRGHVTMLDPFQHKYGRLMCCLLFIPALFGEICWSSLNLVALGATLKVIIGMQNTAAVIVSACIVLAYTVLGGFYAVVFTDVVQMLCMAIGLWMSIPFVLSSELVKPLASTAFNYTAPNGDKRAGWVGSIQPEQTASYADTFLMQIFGCLPFQVYFQRVLSAQTARDAQLMSYISAFASFVMAIASMLIGVAAVSADWRGIPYYNESNGAVLQLKDAKMTLPLVLRYLCPPSIAFVGLGVVSAAAMSSIDSSVLSAACLFARNVAKPVLWRSATDQQIVCTMRAAILAVGAVSCVLAISGQSINYLWNLCSDIAYVVLFPQLIAVVYIERSNSYGSFAGYITGALMRISAGEQVLGLPPLIRYHSNVPMKTASMLASLVVLCGASRIASALFENEFLPQSWDIFRAFERASPVQAEVSLGDRPLATSKMRVTQRAMDNWQKSKLNDESISKTDGNPSPFIMD